MNQLSKQTKKLLLSELRIFAVETGDESLTHAITNDDLALLMTLNEKLKQLGYTLLPSQLKTVISTDMNWFYKDFSSLIEVIPAKPMYPNFPTQVMELSEAELRLHQWTHYFTTYGLESILGTDVSKGWLPSVEDTEKTEEDDTLLKAKNVEVVPLNNLSETVFKRLLTRKQRLSDKESTLISLLLEWETDEKVYEILKNIQIPFKENLLKLGNMAFNNSLDTASNVMKTACQHTGDVFKILDYILTHHKFHLTRPEKRMFVNLLESYPVKDMEANMILSGKKAKRDILLLQYLNYNQYSSSPEHKEAVRKLRNGELKSWESQAKYLLQSGDEGALDFIAQRPGMMVRMTRWLIRLGYKPEDILEKLKANAGSLSGQTLIKTFNTLTVLPDEENQKTAEILKEALKAKIQSFADLPFKGKKVFIDEGIYDFTRSAVGFAGDEGGYIRQGMVFKIPEHIRYIRYFIYWNDKRTVDVDLHAFGITKDKNHIHIGWNGNFKEYGLAFSGDITHSDAAEYIDIDLENKQTEYINAAIHIFSGKPCFREIDDCFAGILAVSKLNKKVKLYNPKNCIVSHTLKNSSRNLQYGIIDVPNRRLIITAAADDNSPVYTNPTDITKYMDNLTAALKIDEYLSMLLEAQGCETAASKEEADYILTAEKEEGAVSLFNNNFFLDC